MDASGGRRRDRRAVLPEALPASVDPLALAACLFCLSFSTVLFTLALFKLLSFFIMPSLFFDLLFIGFPVGAFIGARRFAPGQASFRRTLWILLAAAVFSTAASLITKNFDYLRAHLFEVEVLKLLGQIAVFTGLFIPYFCAYGLSEYVGYAVGRERLRGKMGLVYALYLFGAAAAYVFIRCLLAPLGISAMIALSMAGISLGAALLSPAGKRLRPAALAIGLAALGLVPAAFGRANPLEDGFLRLYKGQSHQSSRDLAVTENAHVVWSRWGRYSYCEIMRSEAEKSYKGLYNDFFQWEYAPHAGFLTRSLGAVPLWLAPPGGSAAIIGAGGGRQVRYAQGFGLKRIVALEIEPAVIDAVRGPLRDAFDAVYESPQVEVQVREARSFMEGTAERFDLIYLPSVGGYPQMMLEPGNLIRTHEAYRTLRDRLNPGGVLAIWYPAGLDEKRILTDHYVRTLRDLDMDAIAYQSIDRRTGPVEYLVLAARAEPGAPPAAFPSAIAKRLPELEAAAGPRAEFQRVLERFFVFPGSSGPRTKGVEPYPEAHPEELPVLADPLFTPITDEKPFLAGNVRLIFSLSQVYTLFAVVGGALLVASAAVVFFLRRKGDPLVPGRSYAQVALVSGLIGANFLLCEHYLVLAFFKRLFVYYDSLVYGAIGFLVLSGLGSIAITPRIRPWLQALAALAMLALLAFHLDLPLPFAPQTVSPTVVLLVFAPVAFVTGSFFPGVFDLCARNPLGVFALDAVGAAFGSLAAFFLPIAFGFRSFFIVAASVFLLTTVAVLLFHRGLGRKALEAEPAAAARA